MINVCKHVLEFDLKSGVAVRVARMFPFAEERKAY